MLARLPSPRPEPPAGLSFVSPRPTPAQIAASAPIDARPEPQSGGGLPLPFYGNDGAPARETLTPAEYQALLERRALAEDYIARRRAMAEEPVPSERRVLLRLLRR